MIDPEYATAKLATQFARTPEFFAEQSHRDPSAPQTYQELVTMVTAAVATTFTQPAEGEPLPTPGQEFQQLVAWNRWLRDACSDRYADLRDPSKYDSEGLGREALNRNPELLVLNGIRRGVKRAMKQSQGLAEHWSSLAHSTAA